MPHKRPQSLERRAVQRNQTRLAELRVPDRKNAFDPIDVTGSKVEDLSNAHSTHREQTEDAIKGPRLEPAPPGTGEPFPGGIDFSPFHELSDFGRRIEIGWRWAVWGGQ